MVVKLEPCQRTLAVHLEGVKMHDTEHQTELGPILVMVNLRYDMYHLFLETNCCESFHITSLLNVGPLSEKSSMGLYVINIVSTANGLLTEGPLPFIGQIGSLVRTLA